MKEFKNKSLLITGGTGSFGNAILKRFISSELHEIRIFSRDEKKQDDLRKRYNNKKLKFIIGDVRDYRSLINASKDVDYIFHAAALKQVPSCEFYPLEAVKTNILGTENLLEAAITNKVKKVVCLSTDKAVYPINTMGMSKALMEKLYISKSQLSINQETIICGTRYGNVMASRGSVIPLFVNQLKNNQPITITDPKMTRFLMALDEAVDLVIYAFLNGESGDLFVQKSPSAEVGILAKVMIEIFGKPDHKINVIGTRHGEKLYETLMSREEMSKAIDLGKYYKIPSDNRDMNYSEFYEKGSLDITTLNDYNSDNANRLTFRELKDLILRLNLKSFDE